MSHLTEENRKTIASGIAHKMTLRELANEIGCNPTTISKEVKKNRIISKEAKGKGKKFLCKKLENGHLFVLIVLTNTEIVFSLSSNI